MCNFIPPSGLFNIKKTRNLKDLSGFNEDPTDAILVKISYRRN